MNPSTNVSQISSYYFATKLKEIRERQTRGEEIINLAVGNPDLLPHSSVLDELAKASSSQDANEYQPYKGLDELRDAFSSWYKNMYDVQLDSQSEILPVKGSKEAIMFIHLAFCNPGDPVLVPDPGYPTYESSAKMLGLNVVKYNLTEDKNWLPCFDELSDRDLHKTKIMWINYPHMPTGTMAGEKALNELISFAEKHNILLVNDNPYSLIFDGDPLSIHQCNSAYKDVLELNSLSKAHNMAGWRVGVVTGSAENIGYLLRVKSNFDSGMYKPIQQAAIQALKAESRWYQDLQDEYRQRRALVMNLLNQLKCTYNEDQSGMFIWAKVPNIFNDGMHMSERLLEEKSIFITPGKIFGANGEQYVRLSLCKPQTELRKALKRVS